MSLKYDSWGIWKVTDGDDVCFFVAKGLDDLSEQWKVYNGPMEGTEDECIDPDKVELIAHSASLENVKPFSFSPHPKLDQP